MSLEEVCQTSPERWNELKEVRSQHYLSGSLSQSQWQLQSEPAVHLFMNVHVRIGTSQEII